MKAKIFEGTHTRVEDQINKWLGENNLTEISLSIAASGGMSMVALALYREASSGDRTEKGKAGLGAPRCTCGAPMIKRHRHSDGEPFWGCSQYPACRNLLPYDRAEAPGEQGEVLDQRRVEDGIADLDRGDDIPF